MFLGLPDEILAKTHFNEQGTEIQTSIIFHYSQAQAQLYSSLAHPLKMEAKLFGTKGEVILHPTWHETEAYTRIIDAHETTETRPKEGLGYVHEIEEVHQCLNANKTESKLWSHQDSLNLISYWMKLGNRQEYNFPKKHSKVSHET